jgi:CheY-like chemotaxis protein
MTKILIADHYKPSLVMTSEIFKDKMPGVIVDVASTGQACLDLLETSSYDMVVVDFDLPDADGISLVHHIRRSYHGPVLLTAYPDKIVYEAVSNELFAYNDVSGWLKKPVKFDDLVEKIERFLVKRYRTTKRFETDLETMLIGKGEGRGKRSPKAAGSITTLSVVGARIELNSSLKMKIGDEITIAFDLPEEVEPSKVAGKHLQSEQLSKSRPTLKSKPSKIKAKIAWTNKGKTEAGVQFDKLSDIQRKTLEDFLKSTSKMHPSS